jgi:hypothetical protein
MDPAYLHAIMSDPSTALQALLDREEKLRADLLDPGVTEINMPAAFFHAQVGLHTVMVDPIGRLWDTTASPIKMIFDPLFFTRKKEK